MLASTAKKKNVSRLYKRGKWAKKRKGMVTNIVALQKRGRGKRTGANVKNDQKGKTTLTWRVNEGESSWGGGGGGSGEVREKENTSRGVHLKRGRDEMKKWTTMSK